MRQIHELTAAEIARQVRDRTITPVEVAQGFLARMDALGTPTRGLGPR